MQKNNQPKQSISIPYECNESIDMNDSIYVIERTDSKSFYKKCRVCNGERYLTVNGVRFGCPCCEHEEETLFVNHYEVQHYRVNEINVESHNAKNLEVKFYMKSGLDSCISEDISRISKRLDLENLNKDTANASLDYDVEGDQYTDYNLAVKCMTVANERELQKLVEYNKANGTSYAMPIFKYRRG